MSKSLCYSDSYLLKSTLISLCSGARYCRLSTYCILCFVHRGAGGGGMFGDVNISAILDSFSISYDKRVRPNYGG